MISYILLLISLAHFVVGAIYYAKDDPRNVEFIKLFGLKVNTHFDTVMDDLNKMFCSQIDTVNHGTNKQLLPIKLDSTTKGNVPYLYETCKSLVGTSIIPLCKLTQTYQNNQRKLLPRSCKEILDAGNNVSGVYEIHPYSSPKPFQVLCDMNTKGGGWTHIQKRFDGSQDFSLLWRDYKFGFGDLNQEFWIGLEKIHQMTGLEVNELLIELTDRNQKKGYAQYSFFAVGSEMEGYVLKNLTGFTGDAGDSLTYHLGSKFTTTDVDQDENPGNCAVMFEGAWWHKSCHISNLNGKHMNKPLIAAYNFHGLNWKTYRGHEYNLAGSRMLIRPVSNN